MKKIKTIADNADEFDLSYTNYSNHAEQIVDKLEKEVIFKLSELGFKFNYRFEFIDFIKNRCTRQVFADKLNVLLVDDKPFFQWYDTIDTKIEVTENGVKSTVTIGLPPSKSNNIIL